MKLCDQKGCGRKYLAKGLCRLHYLRVWKYGSPDIVKVLRGVPVVERIERRIKKTENGCWIYTGGLTRLGYGQVRSKGRMRSTHQVMFEHFVGPVPDGKELDHLCRTRPCCRPDHLEPVTHRENCLRGIQPDRKLNDRQVSAVIALLEEGDVSQRQIAATYGVNQSLVSRLKTREAGVRWMP